MSHIFDALQRAESESSGTESPTFSLATELLQAAEQKMREASAGQPQSRVQSSDTISATGVLQAAEQRMGESVVVTQHAQAASPGSTSVDSPFGDLEQCPVLPVSIPQETRLVVVGKEESLGAEKFRFLAVSVCGSFDRAVL